MNQRKQVDAIMEQAQVFASAWSLVGSRFDFGNSHDDAMAAKEELRRIVAAALTQPSGITTVFVDLLRDCVGPLEVSAAVIDSDDGEQMDALIDRVKSALNQFDAALTQHKAAGDAKHA